MNKIYFFSFFFLFLSVLHNYATVMIVFFVFSLLFVPGKACRIFLGESCLILLKKQKLLCS